MTNKETIDRWAEQIIPAVFKAEDALQKAVPEWKERLAALNAGTSKEDGAKVAKEYCQAIARIIVTQGSDYVPDGTIDGEADCEPRIKRIDTNHDSRKHDPRGGVRRTGTGARGGDHMVATPVG